MHRGNFEIFNYVFVYFFAHFYARDKFLASAVSLGAACAFKPFAIPFFVLFLRRDRVKAGLAGLVVIALLSLGSFALMKGSIMDNFRAMIANGTAYAAVYVQGTEGIAFGHSLLGMLKTIGGIFSGHLPGIAAPVWIKAYSVLAVCLAAALAWLASKTRVLWQALLLLSAASTVLPYASVDYRLLLFLIPFFYFVNAPETTAQDTACCLLFSLLFIPKSYWYFWNTEISSSVILNPAIIIALCALAARDILAREYANVR